MIRRDLAQKVLLTTIAASLGGGFFRCSRMASCVRSPTAAFSRNEEWILLHGRDVFRVLHRRDGRNVRNGRHPLEARFSTEIQMLSDSKWMEFFTRCDRNPLALPRCFRHIFLRNSALTAASLNRIALNIPSDYQLPRGDGCVEQFDRHDDEITTNLPFHKKKKRHFAKPLFYAT